MIVQCPSCASRYRIRDANIPPSGGKIRCPSCSHSFIVYPEAGGDEDRTAISSRGEIDQLMDSMGQHGQTEAEEEQPTNIVSGDELDKIRAMEALQQQLGGTEQDGTVEIQNPMDIWKKAQQKAKSSGLPAPGGLGEEYDSAPTQIVDRATSRPGPPAPPPLPGGKRPASQQQHEPVRAHVSSSSHNEWRPPGPGGASGGAPDAPPAGSSGDAGGSGARPNPDHPGPWKLKTNFGLTYEFPDTKSLKSWLSSREELDGYTLSGDDGDNFYPLSSFPQLAPSSASTSSANLSVPSTGRGGLTASQELPALNSQRTNSNVYQTGPQQALGGGASDASTSRSRTTGSFTGPAVSNEFRPPSRESKYNTLLWLIFLLLFVFAVGVALQTFGVYDIVGTFKAVVLQEQSQPVDSPVQPGLAGDSRVATNELESLSALEEKQRAEVDALIKDAQREMKSNRLQSALDKLNTSKAIDPERAEIYELTATVYEKMGKKEEAEQARAQAKELAAAAAGPDAGVAESPDESP